MTMNLFQGRCPHDQHKLSLQQKSSTNSNMCLRCNFCSKYRTIRYNSIFYRSHFPMADIIRFYAGYAMQNSLYVNCGNAGISYSGSGPEWGNHVRQLFVTYYHEVIKPTKFQGIVEVDESVFGKRVRCISNVI